MSKVNNKIQSIMLSVAVAIVVFWAWGSLGENSTDDEYSGQDPNVPLLVGIWDVYLEFYEASRFSPGTYSTGSITFVITEQTGKVFTGYEFEDPNDDHGSFNGAIIGNSVRIGGYDLTMNGLLEPNEMEIVGSYNNMPLDRDDDDYETGVFVARKRLE
jgi:hypothetical protein